MLKTSGAFEAHQRANIKESFAQFRNEKSSSANVFAIAVADPSLLSRKMNCRIEPVPGYKRADAVIVTRQSGHQELWLDPTLRDYRGAHFSYFEKLGIYLPDSTAKLHDSDHIFAKSAAGPDVALVKMGMISKSANRSHGAAWERRFTHRLLEKDGLCVGNLFDLYKAIGGGFSDPTNPQLTLEKIAGDLIIRGIAPLSDRTMLIEAGELAMGYKQEQDTAYAIDKAQIDFRPGRPLVIPS